MTTALRIRQMNREEVDQLVDWAAREGWNPGLHDAEIFWATDPDAFIAAEHDGEFIGGGAITAYGDSFGFMGFFIVRPEHRGKGYGNILWHARRDRLLARLKPGSSIGLDGVFAMQAYYAAGGFVYSHRNLRFRSDVPEHASAPRVTTEIVSLAQVRLADLLAYDRGCFPADRRIFLDLWVKQPEALGLASLRNGRLSGYGVIRRCREGCKVGPLFADDLVIARTLLDGLRVFAAGGPLFLDAPENNSSAMELVREYGMAEIFGCARMYLGPAPDLRHERIFGVTTFELG